MISSIKHISIIILSAIVLLASGGFNVYVDHCHCKNIDVHSIIFHQVCCEHQHIIVEQKDDCCTQTHQEECSTDSKCCDSFQKFYKLDNTFKSLTEKVNLNTPIFITLYNFLFSAEFIELNQFSFITKSPPPLLFGKKLIFFIKNIKIDVSDL